MEEATEYLKDLDAEDWESRDYEVDDQAFEHHIREDESDEYYDTIASSFPNGDEIADKILGIGWDKLDNPSTLNTKRWTNLYNRRPVARYMRSMFKNIRITRDHMHKTKDSLTAAPVVEEYEPVEEQQPPSEESVDDHRDYRIKILKEQAALDSEMLT